MKRRIVLSRQSGLVIALAVIALGSWSCIPVTSTVYPLLSFREANTAGAGKMKVRVGAGTASTMNAESPQGIIAIAPEANRVAGQLDMAIGLSSRVDLDGMAALGFGENTQSPGFRAGVRVRLTPNGAPLAVAVQPALLIATSKDHEDDSPTRGTFEEMRSVIRAVELRVPVTLQLTRALAVTGAVGLAETYYGSTYSGYYGEHHYGRDWLSPLATLGFRMGALMVEGGVHDFNGKTQAVAGLAVGIW